MSLRIIVAPLPKLSVSTKGRSLMINKEQQPMYRFLLVLTISSVIGLQAWMILFNNFGVEKVGLTGQHVGTIQSIREIPGFLALLAVYFLLIIKEHRLSSLSIILLGAGRILPKLYRTDMHHSYHEFRIPLF